ncbi:LOW QUALITY PROTEIN: hypothetical protein KUTeg_019507 [Tegillarca granosa]|uniref:FAD dependent oxidoreductase domain-containing protein n=1 Tax=Tegillarca granosa TaxID=220873 RepID=A0ABQ9ECN5_TEGGR|nr:LOW QUALITY PROTEIN: hypothetical protein KUTeg_019507 [Tegillarca granosa]
MINFQIVHTIKGVFQCKRLIVAAGAWLNQVLQFNKCSRSRICYSRTSDIFGHASLERIYQRKSVGPKLYTKTCLYTMTPDRHFVVDTCAHKGFNDVIVCCGGGHIYKFSCLMGKILSQMAIDGRTQYDISQFNIDRQALQEENVKLDLFMGSRESAPQDLWNHASGQSKL